MIKKRRSILSIGVFSLLISSLTANVPLNNPSMLQEPNAAIGQADQSKQQADLLKVSEAFGHFIGRNLNSPGVKFDLESIIKGMRDGAAGKPAPMPDEEYEKMMLLLQEQAFKALSEINLAAAKEFLEKNASAPNIVEVQPGKLQYQILQEGHGAVVAPHATPKINYTGKYLDGTVFGTSDDLNGPVSVPLDQTIQGFIDGIVGMKEGEKRKLFVHPDLGYGTSGHLPPNSLLIFDIELIQADSQDKDAAPNDEDELPPLSIMNESSTYDENN